MCKTSLTHLEWVSLLDKLYIVNVWFKTHKFTNGMNRCIQQQSYMLYVSIINYTASLHLYPTLSSFSHLPPFLAEGLNLFCELTIPFPLLCAPNLPLSSLRPGSTALFTTFGALVVVLYVELRGR